MWPVFSFQSKQAGQQTWSLLLLSLPWWELCLFPTYLLKNTRVWRPAHAIQGSAFPALMLFICLISVSLGSTAGLRVCLAPLHKFSSPWLCHRGETGVQYPMASLGKGLVDPDWAERESWAMGRMKEGSGLHPQFRISNQSPLFYLQYLWRFVQSLLWRLWCLLWLQFLQRV